MAMTVAMPHWHLDDSESIINPKILGIARMIELGAYEGIIYNRLGAPDEPVDNHRFEIYDRSRSALSGVVGNGSGTGWDDDDTADLPVPAASIAVLTVGHVLKVGSEVVVVKSVDRTLNTIDVWARGAGGTTAAAQADTTAFSVIGTAINDVDLKNVESFAEATGKYTNYVQTFVETIDMTFTDEIQARKEFEMKPQLLMEAMDRMFRKMARTTINGVPQAGSKSPQIPAMTAGILSQLAAGGSARTALRSNASGVTDPQTILKNALTTCWNAGGNPNAIYINPTNKAKFHALTEQFVRMSRGESSIIGTDNASAYQYNGRILPFVEDQDMPTDRISLVTEQKIRKGSRVGFPMRGPVQEPQQSSLELRYSMQGTFFITVTGVGVDHIDIYNVSI
jgi:hypothetical protein